MLMRRLAILLILPLLSSTTAKGQHVFTWEEFVEELTTNEEWAEEHDWEGQLEEWEYLHQHPVNINTASPQELQSIPLLSAQQVEDIIRYIDFHGALYSLAELTLIPSISYHDRQALPLFLYAGDSAKTGRSLEDNWSSIWETAKRYTKQEIGTRIDIPLYHRKGYRVENGYLGSRFYNKACYRMDASTHFSVGVRMERDPGERGIDGYGAYAILRDMPLLPTKNILHNRLKLNTLVVGDFKASFGMGLLMNQGFSIGKNFGSSRMNSQGLREHRSTDETNFMRGVGASVKWDNLKLSLFYSHRQWDATLNSDGTVKTIVKDGYHRTETECAKRNQLGVDVMGGNLAWDKGAYHLGTTGYFMQTSKDLQPGDATYRQIAPQGRSFGAMSADYCYNGYRWFFSGETSYALLPNPQQSTGLQGNKLATLNAIRWRISSRYILSASQRYYNYSYYGFFSSALSEQSNVQNETGGMLRLEATPWDGVQINTYADVFYNAWPRYGLKSSSTGWEGMVEANCQMTRNNSVSVRYNVKNKEQSNGRFTHHRLRLQWRGKSASEYWNYTLSAMLHARHQSYGEALGGNCRWTPRKDSPVTLTISGLYFHTSDYNSRIYMYEQNVSGMMYIPTYYGHGIHGSSLVRCQLWKKRIDVEMKYGITRYFDRDTQGSGMQTIYSNVKNDITLQARLHL